MSTLLATKRGRTILREIVNLSLELFEDFVEERGRRNAEKEDIIEATEDLESEIIENEKPATTENTKNSTENTEEKVPVTNENGHSKRRLFKGIRRK